MNLVVIVRACKNVWSWGNYFDALKISTSVILKITVENKFQLKKNKQCSLVPYRISMMLVNSFFEY